MDKETVGLSAQHGSKSGVRSSPAVCLEVVGGPMDGLACHYTTGPIKIGRASSSDLPLSLDKNVSGNHALVDSNKGRYWIEDPRSKNGTWIDGNEIPRNTRVQISPGKIFVVASTAVELLPAEDARQVTIPVDVQPWVTDFLEKLSPTSLQIMDTAEEEARSGGFSCIGVRHVFLGLCRLEERRLTRLFESAGIDRESLSKAVREFALWTGDHEWVNTRVAFFSGIDGPEMQDRMRFTPRVAKVMVEARELARGQGSTDVEPLHLLYGILSESRSVPVTVLRQMDKEIPALAEGAEAALVDTTESLLARIGQNLTALARQGKFSPVVGREGDMEKVVDILSRPSKNNALIVGKTGVGKTTFVRGLAQESAQPNCPKELKGKSVVEIPMDKLTDRVRSAKELEKRFLKLAKSARQSENTILFFDDIDLVLAAGRGVTVAPAVLDAAFADDEVWCVATTTDEAYETYFKSEPVLERCFEPVSLSELSEETTASILHYLKGVFEGRYNVRISDEAVSSAVTLTAQYVTDVQLPSKAVQALDKACASAKSQQPATSTDAITVGAEDVVRVLSEWTGLAAAELMGEETLIAPGGEYQEEAAEGETEELLSQHSTWLMARELSDRISSLQSQYHLADAWDRRAALKGLIQSELSKMPPERRHLVAAHLRDMFPVAEGDPQLSYEIERLRAQLTELREQPGGGPASGQFTRAIEKVLADQESGEERETESSTMVLRAVRDLFQFAVDVEKLTKAFLETLVAQGGSEVTRFDLPYWGKDIKRLMTDMVADKAEESLLELSRYLSDLRCWLMACITGYQQAALQWCVDFRDRTSPRSIEQQANLPAWKKLAGLASSEFWDLYTAMVRDLHPDLVEDEVRDRAARIAKQQYGTLKRGSK